MAHPNIVILGAGYTGKVLYRHALAAGLWPLATSRKPLSHLSDLPPAHRLQIDLALPHTWETIPEADFLVWCAPANDPHAALAFANAVRGRIGRLLVLGSTSAYALSPLDAQMGGEDPWIDESWPLDLTNPRVQAEEQLRTEHRAIVFRVAGIYGPGRNPLNWIRDGRVRPSPRHVNLIHVEDLAALCLLAREQGIPGEAYNISDGTPRTWAAICQEAERRWKIAPSPLPPSTKAGKRLSIAKLQQTFHYQSRFPDFFEALSQINASYPQ
jgi:nucleoside-diphosphate-sugar epimerase